MAFLIETSTYVFALRASQAMRFDAPPGAFWRAALGRALRRLACVQPERKECAGCPLASACAYGSLFESRVPWYSDVLGQVRTQPNPYVLRADHAQHLPAGASLTVAVTLVGRANLFAPWLIHAMELMAQRGEIGEQRWHATLDSVVQERPDGQALELANQEGLRRPPLPPAAASVPAVPAFVAVTFVTPLRLQREGQVISADAMTFTDFMVTLMRRLQLLRVCHCAPETDGVEDMRDLVEQSRKAVPLVRQLEWEEASRFSKRQMKSLPLSGITGEMIFRGSDIAPLWPALWIGQSLHCGKGTVNGNGRYVVGDAGQAANEKPGQNAVITESNEYV